MRRRLIAFTLAFACVALLAPTSSIASPTGDAYWQQRGCLHGHPSRVAYRTTSAIVRSPAVLTHKRWRRAHHYVVCVETAEKHAAVQQHVRKLLRWRAANKWKLIYERMPAVWRAWAWRTDGCESTHGANMGSNFLGRFQWVWSTWHHAGGVGDPAAAGYYHEAVLAIRLAQREGTRHWPTCG